VVGHILAGYAYHLNVMPLDARMPDAGALVRAIDIAAPEWTPDRTRVPVVVLDDAGVRVTAVAVMHGRAVPALAYRFDTADGSVVFSGDTAVNEDLIALAAGADILVHQVADLDYLRRHGMDDAGLARMAALHTDVSQVLTRPHHDLFIGQRRSASMMAWAKACGASCGRLWPTPPPIARCWYFPVNWPA